MSTSVHKILVHGPEIVTHALLPIGQLGEELKKLETKTLKRIENTRAKNF